MVPFYPKTFKKDKLISRWSHKDNVLSQVCHNCDINERVRVDTITNSTSLETITLHL